jgi:hypothetical protein
MIPNPILYNDNTIMIMFVVCCLVVLAIIMVPKAIRHRRQVREIENSIPKQENEELEMIIVETDKQESYNKKQLNYREIFLSTPKITDRKTVFLSKETRDRLVQIARRLGDSKMSVSGFIENMAKHHLEEYREEIKRLYKE